MKICQYDEGKAGVVDGENVYPLGEAMVRAGHVTAGYTMLDVITVLANDEAAMDTARGYASIGAPVPLSSVKLRAPITNPGAIWAAAANYRSHQREMIGRVGAADRSQWTKDELMAEFFMKPVSSIIGPNDAVVLPKMSKHVDFECELCAVIGTTARKVKEIHAHDHIFGYTICWDFSTRDPWGFPNTRNIRKGFDTFTGLGPWIVTRDEVPDPQDLYIRCEQNGKEVMTAHTAEMICDLRDHIRFLSHVLTLTPGVLISTGTPAGVSRLAHGDLLRGSISGIGSMDISVVADE